MFENEALRAELESKKAELTARLKRIAAYPYAEECIECAKDAEWRRARA